MSEAGRLSLTNARLVLADRVVSGALVASEGIIEELGAGVGAAGEDIGGDYLIPGLVELHTDHLESHYAPRPGVRWAPAAAVQAHDAQIAASGITTVFDALRIGLDEDAKLGADDMRSLAAAIADAQAHSRLRAEHHVHLRCEVSAHDALGAFEKFTGMDDVLLVSLMDHTPGQRQFVSFDKYREYYQGKTGMSDAAFAALVDRRLEQAGRYSAAHRGAISAFCRKHHIVLASHDDATVEHVDEAIRNGVAIAEFPTTVDAARAAREAGLSLLMGAPNLVRGGSHSGNVSALDLARLGLLDILSSDYVPLSLLQAAFALPERLPDISLSQAIALVTRNPARAVGLTDRGELAEGKRADLVRVSFDDGVPVVRAVWHQGRRVA
jgi:alpha-D-ribose 1-methylphosphonate 5-triphosphate diphosphatase